MGCLSSALRKFASELNYLLPLHTSVAGVNACAVLYSLVETANANNLNVFQYIYFLMLYMPGLESGSAGIEQLLPWSDFIKENCSGLIDVEKVTVENKPTLTF